MWACLLGGVGWGHAGEQCVCLGPGRAACAEGRPGLGLLQAASAGPRPNPLREQPAAGWWGRRWSVWPAEVFLRRVWGTWEPQVGGLLPSLGRGGPHLPAWVQLGLVLASGIWWWVLGSRVRPGWAWGSGGEPVGCSPAAGLVPASAQRAVPPHLQVQAGSEAQRTLEASRVAGVGPPIPSVLQTRRLGCPGWAHRIVLSAPGLPCGGAWRDRPGWQGLSRACCGTSRGPWGQNGRPVWSCHWGVAGRDVDTEARPSHQPCSVHVRDGPASLGETPVCCGRLRMQGGVVRKGRERGWTEDTGAQPRPVLCPGGPAPCPPLHPLAVTQVPSSWLSPGSLLLSPLVPGTLCHARGAGWASWVGLGSSARTQLVGLGF